MDNSSIFYLFILRSWKEHRLSRKIIFPKWPLAKAYPLRDYTRQLLILWTFCLKENLLILPRFF